MDAIKAEREVLESQIRGVATDMKPAFLQALSQEGSIQEAALSVEKLGELYGPFQREGKNSLAKQEKLVEDIKNTHSAFVGERGGSHGGARETQLKDLAAAHDAYKELEQNLKEGSKFYNDLTHLLITFQNKVRSYNHIRIIPSETFGWSNSALVEKEVMSGMSRGRFVPLPFRTVVVS